MYTWGVVKLMDNLRVICKEIYIYTVYIYFRHCKIAQNSLKIQTSSEWQN